MELPEAWCFFKANRSPVASLAHVWMSFRVVEPQPLKTTIAAVYQALTRCGSLTGMFYAISSTSQRNTFRWVSFTPMHFGGNRQWELRNLPNDTLLPFWRARLWAPIWYQKLVLIPLLTVSPHREEWASCHWWDKTKASVSFPSSWKLLKFSSVLPLVSCY